MAEFNPKTCKFLVFGYSINRNKFYHSHGWVHSAFHSALKYMGKEAYWLNESHDLPNLDNTLIITNWENALNLPINKNTFYWVHGGNDHPEVIEKFSAHDNWAAWNCYDDFSYSETASVLTNPEIGYFISKDVPYYPAHNRIDMRWATDLIPPRIQSLKPDRLLELNSLNKSIYWVGTVWEFNRHALFDFKRACRDNGIQFLFRGGEDYGIIPMETNIKLVRNSYFSPAITSQHHHMTGYISCRNFKNISYGAMLVTTSKKAYEYFEEKVIYEPDSYLLFNVAKEKLAKTKIQELHYLMDKVAAEDTYCNRINSMLIATDLILDKIHN